MTLAADILPIAETLAPATQAELVAAVADAHAKGAKIYPLGGQTSLGYGVTPKVPGIGLSTANLARVIDFPARDMTITVEAGLTMQSLADVLAAERQWLPIDVPDPQAATIGGVVATAFGGPRRFGWGTIRDYVIGISAVDGRGSLFKGGGRVVKNVAGYDFCKLLTGSLGTLGVIAELTLKIKPRPERSALAACDVADVAAAETLLSALVRSAITPSAIELLAGPAWSDDAALGPLPRGSAARLVVGLEGSAAEVEWMQGQLASEWLDLGSGGCRVVSDDAAAGLWERLRQFPAHGDSPLVLKASLRPGAVTQFIHLVQQADAAASIQAHAGNGVVIVRFSQFEPGAVSRVLVGQLQPAAVAAGGRVVVLSSRGLGELTRQAVWGGSDAAVGWMTKIKQQFDPLDLLNPGRFVYQHA